MSFSGEWKNKLCYIQSVEFYSVLKTKYQTMKRHWWTLTYILLSIGNQSEKAMNCVIPKGFSRSNRCAMCYRYFLIGSSYLRNRAGGLRKKGELLSSIVFVHSFWKLLTQYILLKKKKSFQKEFRGTLLKATDTYVFK